MDVINEEEKQFLKTLSRGQRVFERTVRKLKGNTISGTVFVMSFILFDLVNLMQVN